MKLLARHEAKYIVENSNRKEIGGDDRLHGVILNNSVEWQEKTDLVREFRITETGTWPFKKEVLFTLNPLAREAIGGEIVYFPNAEMMYPIGPGNPIFSLDEL